jgi:hypothetical protein
VTTDLYVRCSLPLREVAERLGARVTLEDAEDRWAWVLADLDGVVIDITRDHTVPAGATDTRIFRYDNQPFDADMERRITSVIRRI